ncbi:Por secretion system C-terminal sorting domain-containing protein [Pedobacter steynii]|uniref:Por secretion system C-terminal sorting domain-containing protein n=1 Tax=Pedobacter steynii TaxID=430522 RepID=A0A1G9R7F2_9SPHI|nr:S8 family peptidase [Pedobacter steynii]NQX37846.1 S8 family serine peptidase [Pedobacter steynii]SDM19168.1 Por secretion system C-terminal sorting domain-containing protein [Pedobacter steynii]
MLLFWLISTYVQAQIPSTKIERVYEKYVSVSDKKLALPVDSMVLVKTNRVLSANELAKLNPSRQFSSTHFVLNRKALKNLAATVVYQAPANALWKASDKLNELLAQGNSQNKPIKIRFVLKELKNGVPPFLSGYQPEIDFNHNLITAVIPLSEITAVLEQETVLFADIIQKVKVESVISKFDHTLNEISTVHALFPDIDGNGITISLKERMFDVKDLDLLGKYIPGAISPNKDIQQHATDMATIALGNGNSYYKGLGVAPAAKLSSSDVDKSTLPDELKSFRDLNINIQNHSYGTTLESMYGIEAAAYDKQVFESSDLIHAFSAGNSGTTTPTSGVYKDLPNTSNLTGNFKQAKNILVIGSVSRENVIEALSSRGPAYDGRVKPDVVTFSEDGTSGATALASGVAILFEQKYKSLFGKAPSSALARSILINSSDDLGTPQVDYIYGYGKLNAREALNTLTDNRYKASVISQDQDFSIPIQVPANQKSIKVTLVWNDPPAQVNTAQSIVNHLDLSLQSPSGEVILPWVLSSYPHLDSLAAPAKRKIDQLNTVQQVSLENLAPGTYTVHVKGRKVQQTLQDFSIAYSLSTADNFLWTYPENADHVPATEENYFRWKNSFASGKTGKLSVSYDNGTNWTVLNNNTDLSKNFYKWATPDLLTKAILKMEVDANTFQSKPFLISKSPELKVGYNCDDALFFHWSPIANATGYTIYHLKDQKMVPLTDVSDTLSIIQKASTNSTVFAIAAKGPGFTGLRSRAIDYTLQGISCYTRSFTGTVAGDQIVLNLYIGTTNNLKKLTWEKQSSRGVFSTLSESNITQGQLTYSYTDINPKTGPQWYRVTMETLDGRKIQTEVILVDFLKDADFSFYPNPVETNINILNGGYEAYTFELYNILGQRVFEEKANGNKQFDISRLNTGLYIGVISRNGKSLKKIKIIKK